MAALTCDLCGGKLTMASGGIAVCDSCGMEHSPDRMKEKVQEIKGTVRVDNSHMVENYLELACNAKNAGNNSEAESYCNKIIEIDPINYNAWMIKGEAAAWQSTLQNSRVDEGVTAFIKGINYAPEEVKDELIEEANSQIKELFVAMISLRADNFAKWPDKEEADGFDADIMSILNTVINFLAQTGSIIPLSEIMSPVAQQINSSVVQAYKNVILPEYKSERYPWPDDDDFRKFIARIGYCTNLIERAISLCEDDDEEDINRYENLIFLHKEAINARSYDWKYTDLDAQWKVNMYMKPGMHPVPEESRVYLENLCLNESAVTARNRLISQYESKIKEIKATKAEKEAAEKAEKERIAKEEAQKRFDVYWAEHASEKANLENEKETLEDQLKAINTSLTEQTDSLNKEVAAIQGNEEINNLEIHIKKLREEKNNLGILKGKEKKALQEQIDDAESRKKEIQTRMDAEKQKIESEIASIRFKAEQEETPIKERIQKINDELTMER